MIGLILGIAGAIIAGSILKKRKRRTVVRKTVMTQQIGASQVRQTEAEQRRIEANRRREDAERLKRSQAAADVIHLNQVRRDLIAAYETSGATSGDSEKQIRKRIQYDEAIRRVDRRIEKARHDAVRTG